MRHIIRGLRTGKTFSGMTVDLDSQLVWNPRDADCIDCIKAYEEEEKKAIWRVDTTSKKKPFQGRGHLT